MAHHPYQKIRFRECRLQGNSVKEASDILNIPYYTCVKWNAKMDLPRKSKKFTQDELLNIYKTEMYFRFNRLSKEHMNKILNLSIFQYLKIKTSHKDQFFHRIQLLIDHNQTHEDYIVDMLYDIDPKFIDTHKLYELYQFCQNRYNDRKIYYSFYYLEPDEINKLDEYHLMMIPYKLCMPQYQHPIRYKSLKEIKDNLDTYRKLVIHENTESKKRGDAIIKAIAEGINPSNLI